MKRILGLVDAENIYYTPKKKWGAKAKIDFGVLHKMIVGKYSKSSQVNAYLVSDPLIDQKKFLKVLQRIGYETKIKLFYRQNGKSENSNWDSGIKEDGFRFLPNFDELVVVSGDGDFWDLLAAWRQSGKKTTVICFESDLSPLLKSVAVVKLLDDRALYRLTEKRKPPARGDHRPDPPVFSDL